MSLISIDFLSKKEYIYIMPKKKDFSSLKKLKAKKRSEKTYLAGIERLLTILSMLDKGQAVSTAGLAEQFKVSQKTSQRDIAILKRCGYPFVRRPITGLWAFMEGFSLRKVALSGEQASLVSFMSDIASSLGGRFESSFQELFRRLMVTDMYLPFYAKITVGNDQLPNTEIVKNLETAIDNSERVRVQYVSLSKGKNEYILEPLKLAFFDGFWYCIAQAREDQKVLKFRIDRMKKVELMEEKFHPSADIDKMLKRSVNVWFDGVRGGKVLIKVGAEVARYFKQKAYFPLQKIVAENKDGSIVLETYPAHPEEITHTIMHWVPFLTVLEPQAFKDEIKNTVTAYLKSL
jgi:predicted DNA-binding transcriptional regulator YafY